MGGPSSSIGSPSATDRLCAADVGNRLGSGAPDGLVDQLRARRRSGSRPGPRLVRLHDEQTDYLSGAVVPSQKKAKLIRSVTTTYLGQTQGHPQRPAAFSLDARPLGRRHRRRARVDGGRWVAGFRDSSSTDANIRPRPHRRPHEDEPYIFHFPDGNASIARLLVRKLVPAGAPGHTMEDIVTARLDYASSNAAGAHSDPAQQHGHPGGAGGRRRPRSRGHLRARRRRVDA